MAKAQAFTEKKYKQILEILSKEYPKRVNMAGITTCLMSIFFSQEWIVDSGATHHVTTHKQSLFKSHELSKSQKN